jgi:hypothetical protein
MGKDYTEIIQYDAKYINRTFIAIHSGQAILFSMYAVVFVVALLSGPSPVHASWPWFYGFSVPGGLFFLASLVACWQYSRKDGKKMASRHSINVISATVICSMVTAMVFSFQLSWLLQYADSFEDAGNSQLIDPHHASEPRGRVYNNVNLMCFASLLIGLYVLTRVFTAYKWPLRALPMVDRAIPGVSVNAPVPLGGSVTFEE